MRLLRPHMFGPDRFQEVFEFIHFFIRLRFYSDENPSAFQSCFIDLRPLIAEFIRLVL